MNPLNRRGVLPFVALLLPVLSACGDSNARVSDALNDAPFVRVSRTNQALSVDAGSDGYVTAGNENFYIAINKSQLSSKWFFTGYLTQWHPAETGESARTMGTRVVTFKLQNGKLFMFDATDGATWSDLLDPQRVVEAYPVITTYAPFNSQPGSGNYVLIDPSAGLNHFDLRAESVSAQYQSRFEVELSYLQRFKVLADGVSFEQVFSGTSQSPLAGLVGWEHPFRGQGTMAVSLRRYSEGAGFVAQPFVDPYFFWSSNGQYVSNTGTARWNTVKWNIKPGMQPIPWRISKTVARLKADPRLAGVDVEGALAKGVTGWNDAFGFPVFTVVATADDDSYGDDDKNFIVVDPSPGIGMAFANWRENPNTGEIRGASVYFSSGFVESALQAIGDGGIPAPVVVDAGTPTPVDAGVLDVPCAPSVVISQIFGGNGATNFRNQDYVVLQNRTGTTQSLAGFSLQYGSANGTSPWQVVPLTGSIAPGGSYLIGLAAVTGGTSIPAPDLVAFINISASAGKLALMPNLVQVTTACPVGAMDFVGYGNNNCPEARGTVPGLTGASLVRVDACQDTNDGVLDFSSTTTVAPVNSATAIAAVCTCRAPVVPPAGTGPSNFTLAPPSAPLRRSLAWAAMSTEPLCAMEDRTAVIPAGVTPKEFLEKYLTHIILHEVGHTLGLRHNFKGSLGRTSVMDYSLGDDAVVLDKPGTYDAAAVKRLYLGGAAPMQDFCTDENTTLDASCDRFDLGPNPLTTKLAPDFHAAMMRALRGEADVQYAELFRITRYIRAPTSEAQRLEAFNALVVDVAPPLRAETVALGDAAIARAGNLNLIVMQNLFTADPFYRDEIKVNPALGDAAFRARVIDVAYKSLIGSDGYRWFEAMRPFVAVLKAMQTFDALAALNNARAVMVNNRAAWPVNQQPMADQLIREIDAATNPYFQ